MAGIHGSSAYQQVSYTIKGINCGWDRVGETVNHTNEDQNISVNSDQSLSTEVKDWTFIDPKSSLVPRQTEYGNTIGDVKLSEKATDYYNKLKAKFHNMDFIAVSKDMKAQVKQNAASYGNPNKMVVLIDEEKLERMATDESFRKKYEGIIAMSQSRLTEAKNSLSGSGASLKSFGMSVDSDGKESFFATAVKSKDQQKKRLEKKAAEKKEQKLKEKKKAEKKAAEERLKKAHEKKNEESDQKENDINEIPDNEEYVIFEADSMDDLLSRVQDYSYRDASNRVLSAVERNLGSHIDFKG